MDDTGETRDDLKFTELCTPSKVDDIRTMVSSAEENGQDVIVSMRKLHLVTLVDVSFQGWGRILLVIQNYNSDHHLYKLPGTSCLL